MPGYPLLRIGLVAALLGLGGCAGAFPDFYSQRSLSSARPAAVRSYLAYVSTLGPLYIEVPVNPFEAPDAATEAAVLDGARGSIAGYPIPMTTDPQAAGSRKWRVVFAFDGPAASSRGRPCEGMERTGANPKGVLAVATFCDGATSLATVSGGAGGVAGPGDPRFPHLVSQMMWQLFIPYDPDTFEPRRRMVF